MIMSFIIPARNEERTIGACLDAVGNLNHVRASYETILMDNGSTDKTVAIATQKGATVYTVPNVTISALRNLGAQKSQAEYLAFIDADCVIETDWLRNALARFHDPAVACVGCHPNPPSVGSWVQRTWALQNRRAAGVEDVDWLPSMNIVVRKSAFVDVGGFNESLTTCEDVDFCYRLKKKGYRVLSDLSLGSVHYGEARTVREFFKKERWRGQSNLQGLWSHGFYWSELPSVLLPVAYLILLGGLPASFFYLLKGFPAPLAINFAGILLPPTLLALRTSKRARDFGCFGKLAYLYFIYAIARTAAIMPLKSVERITASYT